MHATYLYLHTQRKKIVFNPIVFLIQLLKKNLTSLTIVTIVSEI